MPVGMYGKLKSVYKYFQIQKQLKEEAKEIYDGFVDIYKFVVLIPSTNVVTS